MQIRMNKPILRNGPMVISRALHIKLQDPWLDFAFKSWN